MSLNDEIKALEALRKEEGDKAKAFYKTVDLPGTRTKEVGNAKAAIAAMKKEREDAGQ